MEGRDINKKNQVRAGGALRGPNLDRGWGARCALENQCAATLTEEGSDPGDQVMGDPAFPEDAGQTWVIDVMKTGFDVQKKGGHLQARSLYGLYVIQEDEAGIICAQPREGAALGSVNQAL